MPTLTSTNPSKNYEVIGEVPVSSSRDIAEAVSKARKALPTWKNLSIANRVAALRKVQASILSKKEELAQMVSKEMGMPITYSRSDVEDAVNGYMEWYLQNAEKALSPETTFESETEIHQYLYEATGVAAVISPWNFPVSNFVWGVIPNLVAGNTVVHKHSEECPLTAQILLQAVVEAKLPEGVFSMVFGAGDVGNFLTDQDIDFIAFTGSSATGKKIYEKAGKKFIKCLLELGGSAPGIVFKDAHLDAAAEGVYGQRFFNTGQICDGLKRLIVHKDIGEEVTAKLIEIAHKTVTGDAEDEKTEQGPLVAKRQLDLALEQLEDAKAKGATILCGGNQPEGLEGAYLEPTIVTDVTSDMRIWKEEVFAPILPIVTFETDEEAIQLANDSSFGLGGYIFSGSTEHALKIAKQIETGMISINGTNYVHPHNVFGGIKNSGKGREHGVYGLRELCEIKLVARPKA
jgi:succinate-semialdehyde dehydrogenase/glutarate-semialdehyde dehydrogenase